MIVNTSRQQGSISIKIENSQREKTKKKGSSQKDLWVQRKRDSDEREEKKNTTFRAAAFNTKAHHIFCKLLLFLLLLPQLHDHSPSVYYKSRILSIGKHHNQFPNCCCCCCYHHQHLRENPYSTTLSLSLSLSKMYTLAFPFHHSPFLQRSFPSTIRQQEKNSTNPTNLSSRS